MLPTNRALLVATLLALSAPAAARAQLPPRALLRVDAFFNQGGHGLTIKDQVLFVSTDRSVTAVLVTNILHNPTFGPRWLPTQVQRVAPAGAHAELVQSLADNHIGTQTGHCSVRVTLVPSFGRYKIVWFGQGMRRRELDLEINGFSPPCAAELGRLVNAINHFAHRSGVEGFGLPVVP
jgi:hypothetical protein